MIGFSLKRRSHIAFVTLGSALIALASCEHRVAKLTPSTELANQRPAWEMPEDSEAKAYLAECEMDFKKVAAELDGFAEVKPLAYMTLLDKLNKMDMLSDLQLSKAGLYSSVHPNKEVRSAAENCEQHFVEINTDISLSRAIFDQVSKIDASKLGSDDRRYVEHMLRDYRRSGVDKDQATRDKIKKLSEEINLIGQEFDKNYREGGKKIEIASLKELQGLPQDYIERHKPNAEGKIILTTDSPDYIPLMQYAKSDALRERAYRVYRSMAYPENKPVLENLLAKRYELAQLLGYSDYATYVTEDKMIKSPKNAQDFIDKVSALATPRALEEYQVLLRRLQKIDPKAKKVNDWQKMYLQELIKKEKYQVDAQKIRQYFPFAKVQQGIFDLTQTMFGVSIRPWQTQVWHPSVQAFEIVEGNQVIGRFYLDMHPREGKYKHAAQFGIQSGIKGVQLPIAALVCNFPGGEDPNELLEHSDVETFLHEFGHLLHTMFGGHQTRVAFSGTRTEWDFVEAPSQMLEEWVWDADTLASFARNAKGEVIPKALVAKMRAGRDFGHGLWTKHQLFYAATSLNLYNTNPATVDLDKITAQIQATYSPFGYVDGTHFYASFGHLNGYSAIYYTYMWSLVIASDMFSEFEKDGLRNPVVAQRYRKAVLAPGGSKDAADLVNDFLGRPFSFNAFAKKLENTH
ncbi:Zn-dependent oligopeptidase [Cellvibrio zantedeschiae]|uniref:Zn-dependent oligopeptidase n=1 Tax=Cellvibrio zantedeschiae TaxID=1237077 RepID=A0ABQ3AYN5_9GAMM|nr:M3 family metallopeptidase [Cellvibrio zantedeschiae]GGY71525.1 Zn-dependent oligopeptidase [Cellvibrio zantedeschiae]